MGLQGTSTTNRAREQLQEAHAFTSRLPQKTLVLAGNHELMYCPQLGVDGKLVRVAPELVLKNQERFVHLFKTPLRGTFSAAGYRFISLTLGKRTVLICDSLLGSEFLSIDK